MDNFNVINRQAVFVIAFFAACAFGYTAYFAWGTYRLFRRGRFGELVYRSKLSWRDAVLAVHLPLAAVILGFAWNAFFEMREGLDESWFRVGPLLQWTPPILLTVLAVLMFVFGILSMMTRLEIRRGGLIVYGVFELPWNRVRRAILGKNSRLIFEHGRGVGSVNRLKSSLPEIAATLREAGVKVVEDPEYKYSLASEVFGSTPWRAPLAAFGFAVATFFGVVAWFYFTLAPEYAVAERLSGHAWVDHPVLHTFSVAFRDETPPTEDELILLRELPQLVHLSLDDTGIDDAITRPLADLTQVVGLRLNNTNITDKTLARFRELTLLRSLHLSGTRITGDGLRHLEGMQLLEELDLQGTEMNEAGLVSIEKLRKLQKLDLSNTSIETEGGFAALGQPRELRNLRLVNIPVEDAWLVPLAGLSELISLDLRGTNVTGEGLEELAGLKSLLALSLDDSKITDRGVETLAKFTQLERLSLSGTRITDASAETLKRMTHLEMLTICDTAISPEVAKEIAAVLGEDVVSWGEREEQSP